MCKTLDKNFCYNLKMYSVNWREKILRYLSCVFYVNDICYSRGLILFMNQCFMTIFDVLFWILAFCILLFFFCIPGNRTCVCTIIYKFNIILFILLELLSQQNCFVNINISIYSLYIWIFVYNKIMYLAR